MAANKQKSTEPKFVCPNCQGKEGISVYNGIEKVKGQTKCTNCAYVLTKSE